MLGTALTVQCLYMTCLMVIRSSIAVQLCKLYAGIQHNQSVLPQKSQTRFKNSKVVGLLFTVPGNDVLTLLTLLAY